MGAHDDAGSMPVERPAGPRPRKRLHAPLPAALMGLGLIAGTPDASAQIARPDAFMTPQNTPLLGMNALVNDTIANGITIITSLVQSSDGVLAIQLDGDSRPTLLGFSPAPGFLGVTTPQYCIGNPGPNSCANLFISVQHPNVSTFIVARDDHYTTIHDRPIRDMQVLANDFFNPQALGVFSFGPFGAAHGTPSVSPDSTGGYGISSLNQSPTGVVNNTSYMLDYVPLPGFVGTDRFQYCIEDYGRSGAQTCATVFVKVLGDPPQVPALGGFALAGLSGVLGWLGMRLRRRG